MKKDVEEAEAGHRARQAGGHGDQEVSRVGQTDLDVLGKIVAQNGEVSHLAFPGGEVFMSIQNPRAFAHGYLLPPPSRLNGSPGRSPEDYHSIHSSQDYNFW